MDHRKENWSYELECMRKAVNGSIDGFDIEISDHYIVDRYENDLYQDRTYNLIDISVAIFNGFIIEGFSTEDNRTRNSRTMKLSAPTRIVLGKDIHGSWVIVVVAILSSRNFKVVTCYPPEKPRYLEIIKNIAMQK